MQRPFPWEALYPPGIDWGAPVQSSTLPELLAASVARFADEPMFRFQSTRWSYRRFAAAVDRLAAGLIAEGMQPGDRVALYLPNTLTHPLCFFAIARAGGIVVHLTPLDPMRTLARKLADVGAKFLISTDLPGLHENAGKLHEAGAVSRLFVSREAAWSDGGELGLPAAEAPAHWPLPRKHDVALLQFTGGTTGHPKAAMLSHANLTAATWIYAFWNSSNGFPLGPGDRSLCVLPLFHIFALTSVMTRAVSQGGEVIIHARFDAEAVLDAIERDRVTLMSGVPTMWTALSRSPTIDKRDLSSLRAIFSGGAPLPVEVAERIEKLTGYRLGGGWGMTETSPTGTNIITGSRNIPGGIGVPLPGIEIRIVDPANPRRELPLGEVGEMAIRGPNVTSGYWNRPDETERSFAEGYFLTGDMGQFQPDGSLVLVDRKKDMILCGGFNVYPRVIEEAVGEHPDVLEAAVIGVPDEYRGQAAKVFAVLRPGAAALTLDDLRHFLADKLGKHEMPTQLELRDALPKTPVGKLSRHELRGAT